MSDKGSIHGRAIGIDLGTTYSVVAYVDADGQPVVIPSANGKTTTPSVVYAGERETLVGDEAKERQPAARRMWRLSSSATWARPITSWRFMAGAHTPVNLSALALKDLKQAAERFLGKPVTDAYFTHVRPMCGACWSTTSTAACSR